MRSLFFAAIFALAGAFPVFAQTASDVVNDTDSQANRDALKSFVDNAKNHIEGAQGIDDLFSRLRDQRDEGTWMNKENGIYVFIFQKPQAGGDEELVIFNANNPELEGRNLHVTDASMPSVDVGHSINTAVVEKEGEGKGFSEYTWDDPRFEGDEVDEEGKSPGTSKKVSYAVEVTLLNDPQKFILGSGFYPNPPPAMDDSDDGCAIVSGELSTRKSASSMLNLLLIVSALFLAVSWKSRLDKG